MEYLEKGLKVRIFNKIKDLCEMKSTDKSVTSIENGVKDLLEKTEEGKQILQSSEIQKVLFAPDFLVMAIE